jgi:hypothetical protein
MFRDGPIPFSSINKHFSDLRTKGESPNVGHREPLAWEGQKQPLQPIDNKEAKNSDIAINARC